MTVCDGGSDDGTPPRRRGDGYVVGEVTLLAGFDLIENPPFLHCLRFCKNQHFVPGRNHRLLPALATNAALWRLLNAPRPFSRGAKAGGMRNKE